MAQKHLREIDFTIYYLEVFDQKKQFNYKCKCNNSEPINCWYNNLESFFDRFDLFFLCKEINNPPQRMARGRFLY